MKKKKKIKLGYLDIIKVVWIAAFEKLRLRKLKKIVLCLFIYEIFPIG
jgi:hypothetical protein